MSSESKYATADPTPAEAAAESSSASKWASDSPSQQQDNGERDDEAQGDRSAGSAIKIQPATTEEDQEEAEEMPPNPYLKEPLLHLSNVPMQMSDKELAQGMFGMCLPVR
jgi:hypothetical protein